MSTQSDTVAKVLLYIVRVTEEVYFLYYKAVIIDLPWNMEELISIIHLLKLIDNGEIFFPISKKKCS